MAIDAGIYNAIRAPQIESPMNMLAQVTQLKNAQNQNKLFDMQVADSERTRADDMAVRQAYAMDDPTERSNALRRASPKAYREDQTFQSGQAKAAREAEKARLEAAKAQIEMIGQVAGTATDQASYTAGLQRLAAAGVDVSEIPAQFDPAYVQQARAQALSAAEQIAQVWKAADERFKQEEFGYRQKNDAANRGVTLRGQDMSQSTAIRGQNMADARGREANAVKYDENNIKREEKKATADLTKSSQVASFDTMLGTLDRLGKHPGLSRSVGLVGALPSIPGSEASNFGAELETFQSQAFIPMVAQLKGMGALSDAEGRKLTAAVGALNPKMGEKAFRDSVQRITNDMEAARSRVVGGSAPAPAAKAAPSGPKAGAVMDGYKFKGGDPADKNNWVKQ